MSPNLEVAMRPPEVFVRELTPEEGMRLTGPRFSVHPQ